MNRKPLGGPAYGSIGHLPNSRLGPGDHCVPQGQADICTVKCRPGDAVYVEEKLDGSCCAVWRDRNGKLHALTRAGYEASTSRYEQHWLFAAWVLENEAKFGWMPVGWRIVGEWIAQAHGTLYHDVDLPFIPFIPFDVFDDQGVRLSRRSFANLLDASHLWRAKCVHVGHALDIETGMRFVRDCIHGPHTDKPEGLVYRVEHNGQFDFLAKWVRPDKVDGCYLPEVSGCPAVWNWGPKKEK